MKVPGSDGNSDIIRRAQEARVGEQSEQRRVGSDVAGADSVIGQGLGAELASGSGDRVSLSSIGAAIRQELDPVKLQAERRAKIEALKEQIKNGTYAPSSLAVSQSVGEEISYEILMSGNALRG